MNYPINPEELKNWIVSHANYYRKQAASTKSKEAKQHFEGHVRAMRALWDTMKMLNDINFVGLYKKMDSI